MSDLPRLSFTRYFIMTGHVVMRYHCPTKEQRRQRIFEKVLDACATSPYGRMCTRWVLAGVGSGARVAAAVGTRCRGVMAGFVLMGYPLMVRVYQHVSVKPLPAILVTEV